MTRVAILAVLVALFVGGAPPANSDTFESRWNGELREAMATIAAKAEANLKMVEKKKRKAATCKLRRERVKVYRRNGKSWRYVRKWRRC